MALGEAGGVYPATTMISYGGKHHAVLPKKGSAKGFKVRGGRKQSLYVKPGRSRRRK